MDELNITAEMPEMPMSKVYIRIDEQNRVIALDGGYTTPTDLEGWIFIDEGYGDKYNLCQSHYLPKPLTTMDGIYAFKYESETVVERTEEEIEEDRENQPDPEPSTELIAEMAYVNSELALALIELMEV